MSEKTYSIQEFITFMDMVTKKGLLNTATANSRKNATLQVLDALDEDEKQDLRAIDVDLCFERFSNLHSSRFTPDSLKVYKTRFKKGLGDFLSWKQNPMTFRPDVVSKKPSTKKSIEAEVITPNNTESQIDRIPIAYKQPLTSMDVFPIRIRENVIVQVANLPHDLTQAEAQKIARVIQAHIMEN